MARVDSRFAPSQWETSLQSNAVSHWLGANLDSALMALGLCFWEGTLHEDLAKSWTHEIRVLSFPIAQAFGSRFWYLYCGTVCKISKQHPWLYCKTSKPFLVLMTCFQLPKYDQCSATSLKRPLLRVALNARWYLRRGNIDLICKDLGSLTRYAKLRVAHTPGMPATFPPLRTSNGTAS